jgi:hypothetical protein
MSQILHRQRVRDRQTVAPATGSFNPVGGRVPTFAGGAKAPSTKPTTVATTEAAPAAVVETPETGAIELPADETTQVVQPTTQEQPAGIAPEDRPAETMAGDQQATQARATAETLAGLADDQYTEALQNLQMNQPELYPLVVDELNRMVADQATDEGDGFDLSGVTTDPSNSEE